MPWTRTRVGVCRSHRDKYACTRRKAHKLPVPTSALPPGGIKILYNFYSTLFTATKQSGKQTSTTSEEAHVANSTLSYGELHFLLKGERVAVGWHHGIARGKGDGPRACHPRPPSPQTLALSLS